MVNGSSAGELAEEEEPLRWILKHGEQYTGRSWVGRKGTVVDAPHAKQTAWCWGLEVNDLGRTERDSIDIWKRTPYTQGYNGD